MLTLTEFLLARIAEDEEKALTGALAWGVARVEAECEAKRRIVNGLSPWLTDERMDENEDAANLANAVLWDLAEAYADHPDYPIGGN